MKGQLNARMPGLRATRRLGTGGGFSISGTPAQGMVGEPYSFTPIVQGGKAPYAYSLVGTLPAGLSFSNATGMIAGTPTEAGVANNLSITVTDALGATTTLAGVSVSIVALAAPTNTVAPSISGTPTQGETLSASQGTWTGSPTSYDYQWEADGAAIVGATATTYLLTAAEAGTTVTVTVTAANAAGSASATSAGVSVGTGPIQDPLRLVAMRSQALSNPIALTGGKNIVLTRIQLLTGAQDWASWTFKFASWFHTNAAVTSNKEQAGPQGFTIIAAALEKNTLSTPTQVVAPITFNGGSRSVTLANGDSEVTSDAFLPSSWSSSQSLQGGRTYFVRCAIDVGADGQAVRFLNLATSLTAGSREQGVLGTSSDTSAITALVDTTSDITAAAFADGSAVNYGYGPILAVGLTTGTLAKDLGVIAQGSSFVEGAGDSAYTGSATSGGFVLRGLQSIGSPARKVPTANYAKGSGMWAEIAASNTRRERAWKHAKRLFLDGPTNDVGSSISVASILSSWDTIRARAAIYGLPIVTGLVCPRTTGSWGDDASQTASANFGIGQNRDLINAALIARWQAGEIEYLLDPNLGRIGLPDHSTWQDIDAGGGLVRLQSTTSADKWVASQTSDGIHPNSNGHGRYRQLVKWVWDALYAA